MAEPFVGRAVLAEVAEGSGARVMSVVGDEPDAFADAVLADLPPAPADQAAIVETDLTGALPIGA